MRGREQRQGIAAERDQDVRHALNGNALPCPHFDPFQGMEEAEESPEALLYGFGASHWRRRSGERRESLARMGIRQRTGLNALASDMLAPEK